MPLGLVDGLTRAELVDLVRFLSELGKVGRFAVGTQRVCRRWQVLDAVAEGSRALSAQAAPRPCCHSITRSCGGRPTRPWPGSCRSRNGPNPARSPETTSVALARTQLQVTTPGKVKLSFNTTEGLRFWIDGHPVEPARRGRCAVLDLTPGLHTLGVAVDLAHRREGIRCILDDVPGSPARAQVVLGK